MSASGSAGAGNVTVDDQSDLIVYQGGWDGTVHQGDPFVNRYSNGTFHASNTAGDSATFEWDGGCIWLFGAKRPNHGNFSTSLDGADKVISTTESENKVDLFEQVVYTSGEIQRGSHKLVVINEVGYEGLDESYAWLDIDYIIYEGDDQASSDTSDLKPFITTGTPQVPMALPTGKNPIISISSSATPSVSAMPFSSSWSTTATLASVLLCTLMTKKRWAL